jgi:16S rRNA G966 N2-methylase RsmD
VPIERVECDDETAMRILLADNRTAEKAERESEPLADLLESLETTDDGLTGTGYDGGDLDELLDDLGRNGHEDVDDPGAETSRAEELQDEWGTERGQLWQVGRHRLLCGDATEEGDIRRVLGDTQPDLVFADPPYGIDVVQGASAPTDAPFGSQDDRGTVGASNVIEANQYAPVTGDEDSETAEEGYRLLSSICPDAVQVWWGANHYSDVFPPSPCWLVWDKDRTGNFADAELAFVSDDSPVQVFQHKWNGMIKESEKDEKRQHPNQKPAALARWCITEFLSDAADVLVPFAGSGAAIIGSEEAGATVTAIEYEPSYCAVILERCSEAGMECELISS